MFKIYLRTNTVNGKKYVGQAKDFKRREYQWHDTKQSYAGALINNARKKYGVENFKTEILDECETLEEANELEKYYIKKLNTKFPNGYNLNDGGGSNVGYKASEETRKKIAESGKGRIAVNRKKVYQYTLDGKFIREWECVRDTEKEGFNHGHVANCCRGEESQHKGFLWVYDESKVEAYEKKKRKPLSKEIKQKMSEARKGKCIKTVYQFTLEGKLVKEWSSITETSMEGYSSKCVGDCCNGKLKTHKGYLWSFNETAEPYTKKKRIACNKKTVYQYTLDGEFVKEWSSAEEAGIHYPSGSNIRTCCRGERQTHKGYRWSYTKNEE